MDQWLTVTTFSRILAAASDGDAQKYAKAVDAVNARIADGSLVEREL